jgi:hypothetical protein
MKQDYAEALKWYREALPLYRDAGSGKKLSFTVQNIERLEAGSRGAPS